MGRARCEGLNTPPTRPNWTEADGESAPGVGLELLTEHAVMRTTSSPDPQPLWLPVAPGTGAWPRGRGELGEGEAEQGGALGSEAPGSSASAAFYRTQPLGQAQLLYQQDEEKVGLGGSVAPRAGVTHAGSCWEVSSFTRCIVLAVVITPGHRQRE